MPTVTPLTRSGGMFSRASAIIFPKNQGDGIQSVASLDGAVYLLAGKVLQKWAFGSDGQRVSRSSSQGESTLTAVRGGVRLA